MARRAPGQGPWATARREADVPRIVSGLNGRGETCGAPLCAMIANTDTRPGDYDNVRAVPRPGHADLTAWAKWHGNQDPSGGGHFSGRLTAPLCVAGGIALQELERRGVRVSAHLLEVAGVKDEAFAALDCSGEASALLSAQMDALCDGRELAVIDDEAREGMLAAIEEARAAGDSVGGVIECVACGLPAGIGSPMFDGLENAIARMAFGIPAIKGIEFGRGFEVARMRGSENNDAIRAEGGQARCATNNAGGILGGISTGAPVLVRLAVKPTPSIAREQASVDLREMRDETLQVRGRHDPCIAPRAVPVVEAVVALSLLDAWLSHPAEENARDGREA
jgi:chorismate synthase